MLLDEDPQELEDRRAAWRACLLPGDDVEERLVDDAVVYTWQQDRARRAQANRINANITNLSVVSGPLSVVSGPLSVVSGPLSVASDKVEAIDEPNATNPK